MSDEKPETQKPLPKVHVDPLSIASVGNLNAMVMRKTIEHPDGHKEANVFVTIKRTPTKPEDEPGLIPLIELPALVMLLKAVAEPAMTVRSLTPQPAPAPAPKRKQRRKSK